jgi:nucleoside-diphosphate-sugar epimerase
VQVFLTGGTGFIGRPLTRALVARGWDVTALVRRPDSPEARMLEKFGARLAAGDVTDPASLRPAMRGADLVVHSAGRYEYGVDRARAQRMRAVNVDGTEHVLRLAHERDLPRTVYVSTVQAFGDSGPEPRDESFARRTPCRTAYERSKTDAHEIALRYQRSAPVVIVCPNAVIGPDDHSPWGYFLRLYINGAMPPMAWSPRTVHAPVHVDDLAEGIVLAAEKGRPGETYALSGEARTFREHLACWRRRPGACAPRLWLPAWLAAASFAPLEPLQRMLGLPAFISRETVRAGAASWHYRSDKARRELGWTYRPAETMWLETIDEELELLHAREDQSLLQRLRPLGAT